MQSLCPSAVLQNCKRQFKNPCKLLLKLPHVQLRQGFQFGYCQIFLVSYSHYHRPVKEARPERSADELARTVYVSRLAWATTSEGLTAHFKQAGTIVNATLNTRTRRGELVSVGTGTVEYKSAADAKRAIAELNESELDGRAIRVRGDRSLEEGGAPEVREPRAPRAKKEKAPAAEAAPKAPRVRREREPVDFSGATADPKKVYIRSLSWDTTAEDLSNVFSAVGTVVNVEVINRKDGRSSGCAIVEFAEASDATEAIERLNGRSLDGREMAVKVYYIK